MRDATRKTLEAICRGELQECGTDILQELVLEYFPAIPYYGQVLAISHDSSEYEADSDNLDVVLFGKEWRELVSNYVEANEDDYVLMSSKAVVAFLGAWLWRAAETLEGENEIRSSLIFHLAKYGGVRDKFGLWAGSFSGLDGEQRKVILALIKCSAKNNMGEEERANILEAVESIEQNMTGNGSASRSA